ncbi:MAG: YkgJ family cysteine cluster protein [Methanomassiliicoccales archaeon]|jgi:Fe-S-cluster containining protein
MSLLARERHQVDFSDLVNRTFECIDRCQLCCLCQPEILPEERRFFREKYPDRLILKRTPRGHTAISLKKGKGSCSLLENRRCVVYEDRPHFCRQFPFRLYVGNRVQIEADLSCRGVWTRNGEDALMIGSALIEENMEALGSALSESKKVYEDFFENCVDAGVHSPPDKLRSVVYSRTGLFSDLQFVAKVLETSTDETEMDLSKVEIKEGEKVDMNGLEDAARDTVLVSLSSADPLAVPVYCDEAGDWNIFEVKNGKVEWSLLDDAGDTYHKRSIDPLEVRLLPPENGGKEPLNDYLKTLNNRDSMLGYAYYLVDNYGYDDFVSNVYYGALATSILDLLWRVSLLRHVRGGKPDRDGIREGIIFYDMDRLDAPTLGTFV